MNIRNRRLLALLIVLGLLGTFALWRTGIVEFKLYETAHFEHNATAR